MQSAHNMAKTTGSGVQGVKPLWRAGSAEAYPVVSPILLLEAFFVGRRLPPREKLRNVRNALEPPAGPQDQGALEAQGGGDIFPAISGTVGPLGHQGTHSRHHLLALGSGLNCLELSQVPRLGVLEPQLSLLGLGFQPLTQHQHPGVGGRALCWALRCREERG